MERSIFRRYTVKAATGVSEKQPTTVSDPKAKVFKRCTKSKGVTKKPRGRPPKNSVWSDTGDVVLRPRVLIAQQNHIVSSILFALRAIGV